MLGVGPLIVARLLWGLSFAAMNIANQALPTSVIEGVSHRVGRARAIIAIGPTGGLLGGAIAVGFCGPCIVFLALGLIACLARIFALRLPLTR